MFEFDPLEVGNPMTLGMIEDSLVLDIHRMQNHSRYWKTTADDVQRMLDGYGVFYSDLPYHIQSEIDKINLVKYFIGNLRRSYFLLTLSKLS